MIDADLALRIVRDAPRIAYDTETTGLGPRDKPVGYVITSPTASVYVPVGHEAGGNIPDSQGFEKALNAAFAERGRMGFRTIGHNLAFDLDMSRRSGVVLQGPLEDTLINEGLIHDTAPSFSLENCAVRHGVAPKLGSELYAAIASRFGGLPDRKQMANFWRMPGDDPRVVDYSIGDGVTTLELCDAQQKLLDEYGLRRVWKLECDLIPYLAKMKAKGMKVDSDKATSIVTDIQKEVKQLLTQFPVGFNVRSPGDLEKLFRSIGVTNFKLTAGGRPSFDEKWLNTSDVGRGVLKIRQLDKAVSSFVVPLIETYNVNGRVHATLNQSKSDDSGAVGGRLSCSDPNLQAYPKRNKTVGKVVRQLIVADDGMLLSESDFKQQEPRLFAHYSEDENLLRGYLSDPPIDIHTVASEITGLERDTAKRLGLGILTGMGYEALAGHMGWSLAEATRGHNQFLNDAFPGIKQFQKDAKRTMINRGYVTTLLGRRATVDDPRFAYKAVSRIIQGSGADHMKTALLEANQYAESVNGMDILMTIHDSFIDQHDEGFDTTEYKAILENVATKLGVIVPIPVEVGTGKNWSEASYGK